MREADRGDAKQPILFVLLTHVPEVLAIATNVLILKQLADPPISSLAQIYSICALAAAGFSIAVQLYTLRYYETHDLPLPKSKPRAQASSARPARSGEVAPLLGAGSARGQVTSATPAPARAPARAPAPAAAAAPPAAPPSYQDVVRTAAPSFGNPAINSSDSKQ